MTVLRNENRKALQGSQDIEEQGVKGVHEPVVGGEHSVTPSLVESLTHGNLSYLLKMESTAPVNSPTGSANWIKWATKRKRDTRVGGRRVGRSGKVRGAVGIRHDEDTLYKCKGLWKSC